MANMTVIGKTIKIYLYNNNKCYDNRNYNNKEVIMYWVINTLVITLLVTMPIVTTYTYNN